MKVSDCGSLETEAIAHFLEFLTSLKDLMLMREPRLHFDGLDRGLNMKKLEAMSPNATHGFTHK